LIPIPLIQQNIKRTSRKKGKTVILTDSPYKNELQDTIAKKKEKEEIKERKKGEKESKTVPKKKLVRRNLFKKSKCSKKSKKMKVKDSESGVDDEECLYCGECYSVSNEGWIACQKCCKWAHNSCAGIDNDDDEVILICEHCKETK